MSSNPEEIRRDIEATRGRLSEDVNSLTETVRPSNVARRQADKVTEAAAGLKDRVMGTAEDLRGTGADAVSSVSDRTAALPAKARRRTEGNPLAAGLIALGAGWLLGSLLPASEKEKAAAGVAKEKAQPLLEEAKSAAQDIAAELKEPAKQAAQSVADAASQAKETVVQEGQSTVQDVRGQAKDSAETVRSTTT